MQKGAAQGGDEVVVECPHQYTFHAVAGQSRSCVQAVEFVVRDRVHHSASLTADAAQQRRLATDPQRTTRHQTRPCAAWLNALASEDNRIQVEAVEEHPDQPVRRIVEFAVHTSSPCFRHFRWSGRTMRCRLNAACVSGRPICLTGATPPTRPAGDRGLATWQRPADPGSCRPWPASSYFDAPMTAPLHPLRGDLLLICR